MRCATVGELRAYLDRELPSVEMDRMAQHLTSCVSCEAEMESLRANASAVRSALDLVAPAASDGRVPAWRPAGNRLNGREDGPVTHGGGVFDMIGRFLGQATASRARLATTAVTVFVAMALLFTLPPVQTAASSFLSVFRVNKFVAIAVDPSSLPNLASPSDLGTLKTTGDHSMKQVTLAEAQSAAGFTMRTPATLPGNLEATPRSTMTTGAFSMTFTPDLKKVRAYLTSIGASNVKLPDKLDGAPITVQMSPSIALLYTEKGGIDRAPDGTLRPVAGQKFLYVGATSSPTVNVPDGVDVDQVRSQLLSVPGLPADLVNQLKSIDDWRNTVVVPVVKGKSRDVTVQGSQGVLIQENGGPGETLLWQKDGMVYTMTGNVSESEILAAANSMK